MNYEKKYEVEKYVTNETNIRSYALARLLGSGKCKQKLVMFRGSYGNGKTHLMKMIMQELEVNDVEVKYMELHQYYDLAYQWMYFPQRILDEMESIQILIMEDVDEWDGRIFLQEQMEKFLRAMLRRDKQIIFTSSRPMIEIEDSLQRLFLETYMEKIGEPNEELKRKMLKEWVKEVTCNVPEEIQQMILEASVSVGRLRDIWNRLVFFYEDMHEVLDTEFVDWVLNEMYSLKEIQEIQLVDLLFCEERYSDSKIAEIMQIKEEIVKNKRESILKNYPIWVDRLLTRIGNEHVILAKFWGMEEVDGRDVNIIEEVNCITEEKRAKILKRIHLENRKTGEF